MRALHQLNLNFYTTNPFFVSWASGTWPVPVFAIYLGVEEGGTSLELFTCPRISSNYPALILVPRRSSVTSPHPNQ